MLGPFREGYPVSPYPHHHCGEVWKSQVAVIHPERGCQRDLGSSLCFCLGGVHVEDTSPTTKTLQVSLCTSQAATPLPNPMFLPYITIAVGFIKINFFPKSTFLKTSFVTFTLHFVYIFSPATHPTTEAIQYLQLRYIQNTSPKRCHRQSIWIS